VSNIFILDSIPLGAQLLSPTLNRGACAFHAHHKAWTNKNYAATGLLESPRKVLGFFSSVKVWEPCFFFAYYFLASVVF